MLEKSKITQYYTFSAVLMDDDVFYRALDYVDMEDLLDVFETEWILLFHRYNINYVNHGAQHLVEQRKNHNLTRYSAYAHEGLLGVCMRGTVPGTLNQTRQALTASLTYYGHSQRKHWCERTITYAPEKQNVQRNDSLVYIGNTPYKIQSINRETSVCQVQEVETEHYKQKCSHGPNQELDFGIVGVYQYLGLKEEEIELHTSEFEGKAIKMKIGVDDIIIFISRNLLLEST